MRAGRARPVGEHWGPPLLSGGARGSLLLLEAPVELEAHCALG